MTLYLLLPAKESKPWLEASYWVICIFKMHTFASLEAIDCISIMYVCRHLLKTACAEIAEAMKCFI